ncbi:MAG: hypothetical protein AB7C96_11460 [Hydrogenovibrio sp.]
MTKFPRTISVNECEKFLARILQKGESPEQLDLPVETRLSGFSGYASAIQTLITWAHSVENPGLQVSSDKKSEGELIDEIIKNPHKFTAAMFVKSILGNDEKEVRVLVNSSAKDAINKQFEHKYGQQRGGLCWFAFVDHSNKAFDPNFYISSPTEMPLIKKQTNISKVIESMIEKSQEVVGNTASIDKSDLIRIGRLFYELFTNSATHGLKDSKGNHLKKSVRVIYTNIVNAVSPEFIKNVSKNQPALETYLKAGNFSRYAEISFVDSGLGYVDRWKADKGKLAEHIDIVQEYDTLKKCFKFRSSSIDDSSKGNGLPSVLESLSNLKGFIRVRSGKLSVYRDFNVKPFQPENDDYDFYDWKSGLLVDVRYNEYPKVRGVLVSLLIPLGTKENEVVL